MKKIVLISLILLLSSCATTVSVDYQPGTNFALLKTFRVEAEPVAVPNDPRVKSPFIQNRISDALKNELGMKGLSVSKNKPDLVVKYHLGLKQEVQSDGSGISFGIGSSSPNTVFGFMFGTGSDVATYDTLTITIDLLKSTTDKLLWRGSFETRLAAGSTPESSTRLINEMVKKILDKFPPK